MRIRALVLPWLVALTALLTATAFAAQAVAPQEGKITAIKVNGSQRYTEAQIAAASGLHAGDTASREKIQAAADRLAQLGPFSDVQYRFASSKEDVTVTFQVRDAPATPVSFDNFPWFTDAELADALRQAVGLFDGTAPEQGGILDAMA
ncbi:MAG TPA: POTRA domain-containing protein, partial [Candidatus Acidoferrales bacterium]|nr:POTRA domain-containing protein [Candidatus Acidoferrales bacterium]